MFIYVLECENGKYYVGKAKNADYRIDQHWNGIGSAWTKLHKPIRVVKTFPCRDAFDEDKYTKMYMSIYGIDNVRGGAYVLSKLDEATVEFIEREICAARDLCFLCRKQGHFANACPRRWMPKQIAKCTSTSMLAMLLLGAAISVSVSKIDACSFVCDSTQP